MRRIHGQALLIVCGLLSACSPVVYTPAPHQAPLLEAAGDARTNVLVGTGLQGGEGVEVALQVAHAPVRHLFVHGAVQQSIRSRQLQSFGEAGIGAWWPLSRTMTVELLGGYGLGRVRAESTPPHLPRTSEVAMRGTVSRVYGQLNVARATPFRLAHLPDDVPGEIGMALRLSHVRGSDLSWNLRGDPPALHGTYVEPAVFVRMGDGALQFVGLAGATLALHHRGYGYDWQVLYGCLGMSIDINRLVDR